MSPTATQEAVDWTSQHRNAIIGVLIAVVVVLTGVIGSMFYISNQDDKASLAFGEAMRTYSAPVRAEGTVDMVSDDQIRFTTHEGMRVTLDRTRIVGETPPVAPNETATLVYEQEPRIAGVWIETREVQPAAAPRSER